MTVNGLIRHITELLAASGVENAEGEARFIMEDAFGKDRTWFFLNGRKEIPDTENITVDMGPNDLPDIPDSKSPETAALKKALKFTARRCSGEPIQYVLGHTDFMGLDIKVAPGVLIPRPETELLCGLAAPELEKLGRKEPRILDLCTGSGCIAACMQADFPAAKVYAADISEEALKIAAQNVPEPVTLLQGDLFDALKVLDSKNNESLKESGYSESCGPENTKVLNEEHIKFDLIISNPPYIPSETVDGLEPEVKDHEPRLALDGGADGMDLNRKIINEAADWLTPGGILYMEVDETQRQLLLDACTECGRYSQFEVVKDLAGKDRYLLAKL